MAPKILPRFCHLVLLCLTLGLVFGRPVCGQNDGLVAQPRNWDFGVWVAGATGEENTNSFAEAQTLTTAIFVGKVFTGEIGKGWRRGRFEYGIDVIPLFRQFRPHSVYGGGFEPVILRWNSSLHTQHFAPYIELAGGALRSNVNFPAGDTSNFNFSVRGGGGLRIYTKPSQSIETGCRWSHISNANLGNRNPEFNGVQVSVEYHWFR
jgi:hypothetical protein